MAPAIKVSHLLADIRASVDDARSDVRPVREFPSFIVNLGGETRGRRTRRKKRKKRKKKKREKKKSRKRKKRKKEEVEEEEE